MNPFVFVQYCYDFFVHQVPPLLVFSSHILPALLGLLFSGSILYRVCKDHKSKKLEATLLFYVCILFALWSLFDLGSWTLFGGAPLIMATWAPVDLLGMSMFFFAYYFLYAFLTGKDLPTWQKITGLLILLPTFVTTFLGLNLTIYNIPVCEADEHTGIIISYVYMVKAFFLILILVFGFIESRKVKDSLTKREMVSVTVTTFVFLFTFFCATFVASFLANYEGLENAYVYGLYGLFSMPLFLLFFGYLLIKYDPFQLKLITAQFLVWGLIAVVASQFFFVTDSVGFFLNILTFVLVSIFGARLIHGIKIEISTANQNQTKLIYTFTHQLKGRLSKLKNIFAEMKGGDYGVVPETMSGFLKQGEEEVNTGIAYVDTVIKRSSAMTSAVFTRQTLNISKMVSDIVSVLRHRAEAKSVALTLTVSPAVYTFDADQIQLTEAFYDIVENSITFTTKGSISISLDADEHNIIFTVKDTGIGLTKEDLEKLFKPGGRAEDSLLYNVNSTGLGLVFTKSVIEAHDGKIWAESEGKGKGSTFFITLPKKV